jgi:hypothetical protein
VNPLIHIDNYHVHEHVDLGELRSAVARIDATLMALQKQGASIMVTLADLQSAEDAEGAKIDTLIKGYNDLKALNETLVAQVAQSKTDPAAIQRLVDEANAAAAKIDATLTTPAPAATPAPADPGTAPATTGPT